MELNSVRFSTTVFDKLFYYTAPADALAYGIAHFAFKPIACRQVRYCLATPKKGMLLLSWPFCPNTREEASSAYKLIEFYDILHTNVVYDGTVRRRGSAVVARKMRQFLHGFETFMLQCVLSNTSLYAELSVVMLDFSVHDLRAEDMPPEWFLNKTSMPTPSYAVTTGEVADPESLCMDSELWGKVIDSVVSQCAPALRHFVFVSSPWLPKHFYINLKLDRMLSQTSILETLYMPSVEEYEQANCNSGVQRSCWQVLHNMPIEKRLPNLQRIVVDSPEGIGSSNADLSTILSAFDGRTTISTDKLPQLHCSSKLAVEVVNRASYAHVTHNTVKNSTDVSSKVTCYVRDMGKLAHEVLAHKISDFGKARLYQIDEESLALFISEADELLGEIVRHRPQMQSVSTDIVTTKNRDTSNISICLAPEHMQKIKRDTASLLLKTLSCRMSCPLNLTLEFDWYGLLKQMDLFRTWTTPDDADDGSKATTNDSHWATCFPRGVLKLTLTVHNGLQNWITDYKLISRPSKRQNQYQWDQMEFDEMWKTLSVNNKKRYSFPPHVKIIYRPPEFDLTYGKNDNLSSIREYFKERIRNFVDDIVGDKLINVDKKVAKANKRFVAMPAATRRLRTDLYASCRKLVIIMEIFCDFSYNTGTKKIEKEASTCSNLQRVEQLARDKQFEQELIRLFCKPNTPKEGEERQFFVMPNLKSISILRRVRSAQ